MGLSIGQGFQSALGAGNSQAKANNRISRTNADTSNETRLAANAEAAAEGNLSRFIQSVNNNRALTAGGNAQEALVVNATRYNDAALTGNFSESIHNAEQAGHQAASAAAAGISGNVVDMVNQSTALRDSIARATADEHQNEQNYDVSRKGAVIMSQMVSSLDNSLILDRLDYNINTAQQSPVLGLFARTLQGFFPAGTDALGAFKDGAQSIGTQLNSAYNKYKNGDETQYNNDREANRFSFNYDTSIPQVDDYADNLPTDLNFF